MSDEATFMFADLAGFTAMTEAHGDESAADLAEEFCQLVRKLLPAYGAQEIKLIGDAIMLRVTGAEDAVRLALRIVCEIGLRHGSPSVRVGMHTGAASPTIRAPSASGQSTPSVGWASTLPAAQASSRTPHSSTASAR